MNPGFDRQTTTGLAARSATSACSATTAIRRSPPGTTIRAREPVYSMPLPEGIDCQRCHGPGGDHVRAAQSPKSKPEDFRNAIVNPARLPAARQMEVCMQCHLETTSLPLAQ